MCGEKQTSDEIVKSILSVQNQSHRTRNRSHPAAARLTVAPVALRVLRVNPDRVGVVGVSTCQLDAQAEEPSSQLRLGLLGEGILRDGLEGLLDVDGFFGGCLKVRNVALGLTPRHGAFLRNLMVSSGVRGG